MTQGSDPPAAPEEPPSTASPAPAVRRRRWPSALLALGLLLAGGVLGARLFRPEPPAPAPAPRPVAPPAPEPPAPKQLAGDRVVEGSVEDDRGAELEGARVQVSSLDEPDTLPREVLSDVQGRFRIADLPRHTLTLEVTLEGHDGGERVLRPDDPSALAFVLPRQGELLVVLRDTPGTPVAEAEVLLTGTGLWPAARAHSTAVGECLFEGLPGGQYRARARRGTRVALPSSPLTIVPGERAKVELTMTEGAALRGRVLDRQSGEPIAAARIALQDLTPGLLPIAIATDAQGAFEFTGLWPGAARLDVQHDNHAGRSLDLLLPYAGALQIELDGAASLRGRVVDDQGRVLAGALLSVSTRDGLPASALLSGTSPQRLGELGVTQGPVPEIPLLATQASFALGALVAESDAQGAFRIAGLAPGHVVLRAARAGYAATTLELDDLKPHAERADIELVLRRAGRVTGRVVDARGRGVGGVYIAAHAEGGIEQSALTDERGEFTIQDVLGQVNVEARPEGYSPLVCQVAVSPGAQARCDLALASEVYELHMRIVDEYGFGLEGALVTLRAPGMKRAFTQLSGRDGALVLRELPAPPYTFDVALRGYVTLHDQPANGEERELSVTLDRAASLAGVVIDAAGQPVPNAFVSTDEGDATADTDATGGFVLDGVAPGALTLWAVHPEAGEGRSAEVRARASDLLSGVRVVLPGRFTGRELASEETEQRSPARPAAVRSAEERTRTKPLDPGLALRGNAVIVDAVAPSGPAQRAGLRAGDSLVAVDGEPVLSVAHARGMLRDPANTTATLRVLRERQPINLRYRRPPL